MSQLEKEISRAKNPWYTNVHVNVHNIRPVVRTSRKHMVCSRHGQEVWRYMYSSRQKKTVTLPFQMAIPCTPCTANGNRTGRRTATAKRWNMQSTIPIVARIKRHLESLSKAKRSITLSKRSELIGNTKSIDRQ